MSEPLLPDGIADALQRDRSTALEAVRGLSNEGLRLLTLWALGRSTGDREYDRVLAIDCVNARSEAAIACRLWLMHSEASDLGVAITLIGKLEREAVEEDGWPPFLGGELLAFLRRCLKHPEPSVRSAVLSCLALAGSQGRLSAVFPAVQARQLANELVGAIEIKDEDDSADMSVVLEALDVKDSGAPRLVASPGWLSTVALQLASMAEALAVQLTGLEPLIDFVRRRALLDDALVRALRADKPIQTVRILADSASTRILRALVSYSDAVTAANRPEDFDTNDGMPDFGTSFAWAPTASVSLHLLFQDDQARPAFNVLAALVAANGRPQALHAAVDALDPQVASAVLHLLARLEQLQGDFEIVLTDPAAANWQRSVLLGTSVLGDLTISSLAKRARAAARSRAVIVHQEHVPQANTVSQVFEAVDAMLSRGVVTPDDISDVNSARQVNYYRQGARILGLFDDDNQPTSRARALVGLSYDERLAITAVFFEDSVVGRAWRAWAGVDRLGDVAPNTAKAFLEASVVGLTGTTPSRRASTLRKWHAELMPHYPGVG